jgi:hypothetical protein
MRVYVCMRYPHSPLHTHTERCLSMRVYVCMRVCMPKAVCVWCYTLCVAGRCCVFAYVSKCLYVCVWNFAGQLAVVWCVCM